MKFRGVILHVIKYTNKFLFIKKHTKWRLSRNCGKSAFLLGAARAKKELFWIIIWNKKKNFFIIYISFAREVHTIIKKYVFFAK